MSEGNGSKVESFIESILLKSVARVVMPLVATGFIGLVGWYISDTNKALKELDGILRKSVQSIELITQQIDLRGRSRDGQINLINAQIADHETRIRVLERPRPQ